VELPSRTETLVHARLCAVLDDYLELGGVDFDWNDLVADTTACGGGSRKEEADASTTRVREALADIVPDLRVEGFFREYYHDDCQQTQQQQQQQQQQRVEACIFRSRSLRQFIVCYRGGSAAQSRPLLQSRGAALPLMPSEATKPVEFHVKHPGVTVHPTFRDAYLAGDLEEQVFGILHRLSALHPFCDVAITGCSFGAAVATLGAARYATLCPQMRVAATVFGSPRVGGDAFRQMVHSLPNLRVARVELAERDVYTCLPEGSRWHHAGHSVSIAPPPSATIMETMVGGGVSSSSRSERSDVGDEESSSSDAASTATASSATAKNNRVVAYRFDHGKPGPSGFVAQSLSELSRIVMLPAACLVGQAKAPGITSYIEQMEGLRPACGGGEEKNGEWATEFAGLVGDGVQGAMC